MNIPAIIKNRISEHIIEFLLQESGYRVKRLGQEGFLNIVDRENYQYMDKSDAAKKLSTVPSFVIFERKSKAVYLVKIRFSKHPEKGRNISYGIKQLLEYWSESILILVTKDKPYFRAINWKEEQFKLEDLFPKIKKETLKEFEKLVEEFL